MNKQLLFLASGLLLLLHITAQGKSAHLTFIANKHQWLGEIKYKADVQGGAAFFLKDGFTFNYWNAADVNKILEQQKRKNTGAAQRTILHGHAYHVSFHGCNEHAIITGEEKQDYYYNYFIGNDSSKWAGNVPVFAGISYKGLYNGIDLNVYSRETSLKYDFIVAPGADASVIAIAYKGVKPVITRTGDLKIKTTVNEIIEKAPYVYQLINGVKKAVKAAYKLLPGGNIGFQFPQGYDKTQELVIDPLLVAATFSGATSTGVISSAATYDDEGNLYTGANDMGPGYPVTLGAYETDSGLGTIPVITKFNADGTSIIYATYYGSYASATALENIPDHMAVNRQHELIITGATRALDFPVTAGCFSDQNSGLWDIFVMHFNAAGSALIGSTYVGGSGIDGAGSTPLGANYYGSGDIQVDSAGNIYVCNNTRSTDFPVTAGAIQPALASSDGFGDACIFKLNATCSELLFSTYLGGVSIPAAFGPVGNTGVFDMKLNSKGDIIICGATNSPYFPVTQGTFCTILQSAWTPEGAFTYDGFISVLKNDGSALLYSTFLGGYNGDNACVKVAVGPSDNIYVTGNIGTADSTALVLNAPYNVNNGTVFITEFAPNLATILASTRLGSIMPEDKGLYPTAFEVDDCGNSYWAGAFDGTGNSTIALTPDALLTEIDLSQWSSYICSLAPGFSSLTYATMFGNEGWNQSENGTHGRFDKNGILYASKTLAGDWNTPFIISGVAYYGAGNGAYAVPVTNNCWSPISYTTDSTWRHRDVYAFKFDLGEAAYSDIGMVSNTDSFCGTPVTIQFTDSTHNVISYLWDFGDGTSATDSLPAPHTYTAPGTYVVKMYPAPKKPHGCSPPDSVVLHITASDTAAHTLSESFCNNIDSMVLKADTGFASYLWQDGATDSIKTITTAGTYWVRASGYCRQHTDTFSIQTVAAPVFSLGNDTTICSNPPFLLQVNIAAATSYLWQDGSTNSNYLVRQTGTYSVTVKDQDCATTDSINISFFNLPQNLGADTTYCLDKPFQLLLQANTAPGAIVMWSDNSASDTLLIKNAGTYWIQVMDSTCMFSDTIQVAGALCECSFEMPSAFTPNGDGHNDVFRPIIEPGCQVRGLVFNIYNRWGQLIYTGTEIGKGWDGTEHGVLCDIGTYMYTIQFEGGTLGKLYKQKGDVTLIR